MKAVVDRHGRPVVGGTLFRQADRHGSALSIMTHTPTLQHEAWAETEIVATNWTDATPAKFAPPRIGGVPVCVGDDVLWRGHRFTITAVHATGSVQINDKCAPSLSVDGMTLLRFANTTEDIGAVDMSRAAATEGEWMAEQVHHGERERYRYGSDHRAPWIALNVNGMWAWASAEVAGMRSAGGATTREVAERMALGKPVTTAQFFGTDRSFPKKPEPTPALIPATEQARRVRQYAEFRAAVDAACPVGCKVVTDPGRSDGYGINISLEREHRATGRIFGWDRVDRCTGEIVHWIEQTVEDWDRQDGEQRRLAGAEGGGR